jgi:hypothetical protein
MHWVGFEPTISASYRAKTVNDLDRSASVTGILSITARYNFEWKDFNIIVTLYLCLTLPY